MSGTLIASAVVANSVLASSAIPSIPSLPLPIPESPQGWLGTIAGIPVVGYVLIRLITRVRSRDSVEFVKDRAETDLVKTFQEENEKLRADKERILDRLEKVSEERNLAVQQLGRFSAESEMNRTKIGEFEDSVRAMTIRLEEQNKLLQAVLLENGNLKAQISHLETLNSSLNKELGQLSILIKNMGARTSD